MKQILRPLRQSQDAEGFQSAAGAESRALFANPPGNDLLLGSSL
ncbi:MAG: hypothetical protein ACRDGM_13070 [bacterium]